jgi:hypothetical protein
MLVTEPNPGAPSAAFGLAKLGVVVNGKVYMANHDNSAAVYGLLPPDFGLTVPPASSVIPAGGSGTLSVAVWVQGGFTGLVNLSASAPAGTTVTMNPTSIMGGGVVTMTVAVAPATPNGSITVTVTGTSTSGSRVHAAAATVVVGTPLSEILLYAKDAGPIAGTWRLVADAAAAGGTRIEQPDAGAPKIVAPLASPADYFELGFTAEANVPYHFWLRARAQNDSYNNDSVDVQFSGSVTSTGTPANRIGTTEATTVVLEDCTGCGVAGWGWQDNGYGTCVLGPALYFTAGPQTIRIQGREDGISLDQIVLSPARYVTASPGLTKNDTTILPLSRTVVRYPATAAVAHGTWRVVADTTAAGGSRIDQADTGAAKIAMPLASLENYFELTFTADANRPYRLWIRGRAQANSYNNDSVYVQSQAASPRRARRSTASRALKPSRWCSKTARGAVSQDGAGRTTATAPACSVRNSISAAVHRPCAFSNAKTGSPSIRSSSRQTPI